MEYPLTITAIARRAESLWAGRPVVSRTPGGALHRSTYGECLARARRLAGALHRLTSRRISPFLSSARSSTPLNLRLHPDELAYIAGHAEDRVVLVDPSLLPLLESFRDRTAIRHVIVAADQEGAPPGMLDYESLLADAPDYDFTSRSATASGRSGRGG